MFLAEFMTYAEGAIIEEAVSFARTITPLTEATEKVLRNHFPELLRTISEDLATEQSKTASIAKSWGAAAAAHIRTQADEHGLQRAEAGLNIEQLLAEYRALRSSVLRLWAEHEVLGSDAILDIGRFNEAIDQAVAESVRTFSNEAETRRQIFLAALGHDLRGPLNAMNLTSTALHRRGLQQVERYTKVLTRSAERMTALLEVLLDYNVVSLGRKISTNRSETDLALECEEEVHILRAALPETRIDLTSTGDCKGNFDACRIREGLCNLIMNAAKHGVVNTPVQVRIQGADDAVNLAVTNTISETIPAAELALLFEPMRRRVDETRKPDRTSLGLGLFITREISRAHDGETMAKCEDDEITVTIVVPK